ncbi:ATP-binding protein [Lysobacter changpingensis]|jgi:serine/threonine-protein kinase RsbW|uniref:ATP-binding protein n=1 Tax=Lysobacter changpingensis TaxID=2792784 RepID=UPI001A8F3F1D|nr:ATP-binding protein [Lysobacter changpingensis]
MQIRITVPNELVRLRDLTAAVDAVLDTNAVAREVRDDVRLIAEEIVANAIEHGGCDAQTEIIVDITSRGEHLQIEFRDCGRAFDPLTVAPPELDADIDERGVGGLGLHLVRELAENLSYTREEPYNVLRVTVRGATQLPN